MPDKKDPSYDDADQPAPERPGRTFAPRPIPPGVPVAYLRSINFSSFIYRKMIDRVTGSPQAGDIVAVADKHGGLFGWAFFHPQSQLTLRMITHETAQPDNATLAARTARAVSLRRNLLNLDATTDAYRLIHAEGDGLPGLVADRFGPYVVIELFSLAMFRRLEIIEDAIVDAGVSVKEFIVRADKKVLQQEGFDLVDHRSKKDQSIVITENGVKFTVDLSRGHKTGFFCDQRENRLALTTLTGGKRMLDVCCYSGGFSCYAATIGAAASVTAVDLDEEALATAADNAHLNEAAVDFHHADAFDFLRAAGAAGQTWDVVVVDPSKFVPSRTLMDVGLRKYADLNRLALGVVAPGGMLLTCSCSGLVDQGTFVQTLGRSARYAGKTLQIFRITGAAADHPTTPDAPEAAYLKAVWARVE